MAVDRKGEESEDALDKCQVGSLMHVAFLQQCLVLSEHLGSHKGSVVPVTTFS